MIADCGCCVPEVGTAGLWNPPGASTLTYRVGTHGSFLRAMLARLATVGIGEKNPLEELRVRAGDDPSIALLDAWATVADVLTFYQERIANEGFLRTATERRSVVELARLIGYQVRPGVAATTTLAYNLDDLPGTETVAVVPAGSRAQSVPGPGELPQSFETSADLSARSSWNTLHPRMTRPTVLSAATSVVYVTGIATGVRPNDRLLLDTGQPKPDARAVATVTPDAAADRTELVLQPVTALAAPAAPGAPAAQPAIPARGVGLMTPLMGALRRPPSRSPEDRAFLRRDPATVFAPESDLGGQLLGATDPALRAALYRAWGATTSDGPPVREPLEVLRIRAVPYGATAPLKPVLNENGVAVDSEEWPLVSSAVLRASVTYQNAAPTAVVVEVSDGQRTATASLPLPTDQVVQLPQLGSVRVVEPRDPAGVGTGVVTLTYSGVLERTVTVGEPPPVINVAAPVAGGVGTGPVPVVFDDEPTFVWRPDVGQTLTRAENGGRITVRLRQRPRTVDVSYERARPPVDRKVLPLDTVYDGIVPNTWLVIERPGTAVVNWIEKVETVTRNSYNLPATITQLTLTDDWLGPTDTLLSAVRRVSVYAQAEPLQIADEPWTDDIAGATIPLDALYEGLTTGRRLVLTGERTDVPHTPGVEATELVMLAGVEQAVLPDRPGDRVHTTLVLTTALAYTYRRATVRLRGNVVAATHGETSADVLGSGNGATPGQSFPLRRSPLTYLPADTPNGTRSTLEVRVDGVRWHESDDPLGLGPTDHAYRTSTADDDTTTVLFGDGVHGARLPTGTENVTATYRTGIGAGGNLPEGRITQLQTRPLGVNGVTNPLPASGGADRDSLDQARRNVPLGVLALDRLVSVSDYADFARARTGIGKASALRLSDGVRSVVHLTIAGADDADVEVGSGLFQSLRGSLHRFGDPNLPVVLAVRELVLMVVRIRVAIDADHSWPLVEPQLRARLLERFGFDRRELGQHVLRSEIAATVQSVPGVIGADVAAMAVVPAALDPGQLLAAVAAGMAAPAPERIRIELARYDGDQGLLLPAQLALLSPVVPDMLILEER
jgi:predicted phage baseplate assembly protein